MRIGLSSTGQLDWAQLFANVATAEKLGFESIWLAEHYFFRDAMVCIGALATTFKNLTFGTGIISPYTRNIGLLAMSAATLSEVTNGRFILGLGTNSRFWKPLGISDPHPLKTMRESVIAMQDAFDHSMLSGSSNATVEHSWPNLKLDFHFQHRIPIYIGAIGKKMLRLSTELADGVILSAGTSPEYASETSVLLNQPRDSPFEIASYIIALTDDKASTKKRAKERLVGLLSLQGRESMLGSRMAKDERIPKIREVLTSSGVSKAAELVGDDILEAVSISGSNGKCRERIQEYVDAGITLPILSPSGGTDFSELLVKCASGEVVH